MRLFAALVPPDSAIEHLDAFLDVRRSSRAEGAELDRWSVGARTAAATAGIEVDGTRFRPHLTVAPRGRPGEVSVWVRLLDAYEGPSWTATGPG